MWPLSRYPNLLPKGHEFFEKWGVWAIVIGRFSGPLRASVPIVAGVTQMPQIKFQIANWSSAFLWAFVLLSPGTYGMKWWLNHSLLESHGQHPFRVRTRSALDDDAIASRKSRA